MTLNPYHKKWIYRALIMLIFIFAFALRVHHIGEKKGFHVDEVLSIIISDYENVGWTEPLPEGEYTGKELKNIIFKVDPSFKNAAKDVFKLWKDNRDTPHTNFYYSLLRISLIGVESDGYEDFQEQYIFRAGALNLAIFTLGFFSFLLLLNLITKDKNLILLGLVVAFINKMDISNALFMRPYVLQSAFVIIFTAFLIWVSKRIEKDEYKETWQNMFIFALPLSFMLLTGYYAFIYAFFLGLCFVAFPLKRANKLNLIGFFFAASVLAVFYNLVYYSDFLKGFYSTRARQSMGASSNNEFFNLDSIPTFFDMLVSNVFYATSLILILAIIIYKLIKKESFSLCNKYLWCIMASFLTCFVIILIAPYKIPRYIVSYVGIISLIYPLLVSGIKNPLIKRASAIIIASIFLIIAIIGNGIDYKFDKKIMYPSSIGKEDTPVYIAISDWMQGILFNHLDDEKKFIICNDLNSILEKSENKDCIILINAAEKFDANAYNFKVIPNKSFSYIEFYERSN